MIVMAVPTKELFDIMTAEVLYYAHILYKVDYMEKYDITKTAYEENCDTFIEQWKDTNLKDNSKIETFIELIRPKSKILDIGAGFGKDVSYFNSRGFDCVGIDFCDNFIEKSKILYDNVTIYKMDFLNMNFPQDSFDALWSRGALFHISKEDFHKTIAQLSKILKPNGIFYIQLIAGNHDAMRGSIGSVEANAYYSYYTDVELNAIMGQYGFEYIKAYPAYGWLNHYYKLVQ